MLPADSTGPVRIRSNSRPGVLYKVTEDSCSCTHAARGNFGKHVAELLLKRYIVNPGQLNTNMGTKLGTSAGGLDDLCRHYLLRQEASSRPLRLAAGATPSIIPC